MAAWSAFLRTLVAQGASPDVDTLIAWLLKKAYVEPSAELRGAVDRYRSWLDLKERGVVLTNAVEALKAAQAEGLAVAQAHLHHLNPFPANLGEVLSSYDSVLCPEMNAGQLSVLLRARYLVDVVGLHKVEGLPFQVSEILTRIQEMCA